MTDHDAADIAWMRSLAEEGQQTPMRGGSILFGAGLIYGLAALAHWAAAIDLVPGGGDLINTVWIGAIVLHLVLVAVISVRLRGQGVRTAANRASATAWMAVGLGIFALFASIFVLGLRVGEDVMIVLGLAPSIIMVFYGLGWAVSAAMGRSKPLWMLATVSFLAAPVLAALTGSTWQFLAYAVALFGLMALPGWQIMRRAGKA